MKKWKDPNSMQTQVLVMQSPDETEPLKDVAKVICPCTDAVRSIPAEESAAIVDGILFKAEIKLALGPGTEKLLYFETPAATLEDPVYLIWGTDNIKGDVNNIDYQLFEEVAWTSDPGDTLQPIININRVLAATVLPKAVLWNTVVNPPTYPFPGATEIDIDAILGSQVTGPQTSPTGGTTSALRFNGPLKPATKHVLRLFNNDGSLTANITVKSSFLEVRLPDLYARVNP